LVTIVSTLGSAVAGEAQAVARSFAIGPNHRRIAHAYSSAARRTVSLGESPGRGGRNQELALAPGLSFGSRPTAKHYVTVRRQPMAKMVRPTRLAQLWDAEIWQSSQAQGLGPSRLFSRRHDSYTFFAATGGLFPHWTNGPPMSWTWGIVLTPPQALRQGAGAAKNWDNSARYGHDYLPYQPKKI